jgi:regulator of sigma E protease
MTTVLSIIIVFGTLVFFHEFGHLLLAKRAGILCREFAIGFGPKIYSFKKDETVYTLRLLPLGGFVRMAGEDPEVIEIKTGHDVGLVFNDQGQVVQLVLNHKNDYPEAKLLNVQKIDLEHDLTIEGYDLDEELCHYDIHPQAMMMYDHQEVQIAPYNRQFGSKTLGQRAIAIFAGPLANFILAFVILFAFALSYGVPVDKAMLGEVHPNTPAEQAGLQQGDRVLSVDQQPVTTWDEIVHEISTSPGQELTLMIERDGQQVQVPITPDTRERQGAEGQVEGFIGVSKPTEKAFLGAIDYGFSQTVTFAKMIFTALGMLVSGGLQLDDLAGPVGIFQYTGEAAQRGLPMLLHWTAILSVNLGIMNLLPIPALDGGRLLFLAVEALRGRPIDPQKEGVVHFIGFALLMLLILVVTWNDIQRLFF